MNTGHPSIEGQLGPHHDLQAGTHASRLGLCSRSGGRGVFLAGGDTAGPEGLFSRRQGLEPGLIRAMVPCSWLEILWDACGGGEKVQVSHSAACPGFQGAWLNWDTSPHQREQDRQLLNMLLDMILVNSSIKFLFIFPGNFPFTYSLFSGCTDL